MSLKIIPQRGCFFFPLRKMVVVPEILQKKQGHILTEITTGIETTFFK